jgi:hypothetical protein
VRARSTTGDDHRISVREASQQHEGDDAVVPTNMDALEWLRKHLEEGGSDVLREMVKSLPRC